MGIKVGELFVALGSRGGKELSKELKDTDKSLKGIFSSTLEAKAAIGALIYGLERLTGFASQIGMDLNKFQVSTGLSANELQKWQYALQKFDVDGKETEQTIRGVQSAMTDMLLGKGAPEGLGVLADAVGFDPERARDTFYVMSKIQEFAKKFPPDVAAGMLKGFNVTPNMLQGLKMMNLETDRLANKDIITQKEIQNLTAINKEWKEFWFTLKTLGTKMVAANGLPVIKMLVENLKLLKNGALWIVDMVQKSDKLKFALLGIAAIIAVMFAPITTAAAALAAILADLERWREGKKSVIQDSLNGVKAGLPSFGEMKSSFKTSLTSGEGLPLAGKSVEGGGGLPSWDDIKSAFMGGVMPAPAMAGAGGGKTVTATQNNTFHIDGAQGPQETADVIQKKISGAARQFGAQAEGR